MIYTFRQFLIALDADDFNNALMEDKYEMNVKRVDMYLNNINLWDETSIAEMENFQRLVDNYKEYVQNPETFRTLPWNKAGIAELEESLVQ